MIQTVRKRDGRIVGFNEEKIKAAIRKAMLVTEKGEDGSSDLYSLVEFNGLNKITSFQRSYRSGRFGATPNIE